MPRDHERIRARAHTSFSLSTVQANATSRLSHARVNGDTTYDPSTAIRVYYSQVRIPFAVSSFCADVMRRTFIGAPGDCDGQLHRSAHDGDSAGDDSRICDVHRAALLCADQLERRAELDRPPAHRECAADDLAWGGVDDGQPEAVQVRALLRLRFRGLGADV